MSAEVRPGYELTEIGMLPDDWDISPIESVTPRGIRNGIVDGPFGSNLKTIHYRKSGIPIVTSGYVTDGVFSADTYMYVDELKFQAEKRSAVKPGDIIMAKIGARCGASAILPDKHPIGILSGNALKISVDQLRHSTLYVWQVLWGLYIDDRINELRTVGAQPAISMANLKKYKIPLPSLPEQRAIAAALSDMDALISGLDQLMAKKRDIRQATMQQLLTGHQRLSGFSGEWKVKRFAELATPCKDRVDPRKSGEELFCIELEHIGQGTGRLLGSTTTSKQSSLKSTFKPGDVLFGKLRAYLRKFWLADCQGTCSTEIWPLVANRNLTTPEFLFQLVKGDGFIEAASTAYGTHMPRSDWNVIKEYEVRIPCIAEQTAIATILSDMDSELATIETRRNKAYQLKQGMMQELLTGRIRVFNNVSQG